MCGIPMKPDPDAVTGRKLTFEQAVAHIGGLGRFITDSGERLIEKNRRDYIWKFPGVGYCTYCHEDVGDLKARHGTMIACPVCGHEVQFRHEARGHSQLIDQFVLYEWRRSVLDDQTVVLTAVHVWRESTKCDPQNAMLHIDPTALYVFRPDKAVTVYKVWDTWGRDGWRTEWHSVKNISPEHTKWGGGLIDTVIDWGGFQRALEGTRIGETYLTLKGTRVWHGDLELMAIANCARRPWLEYLAKCGQQQLAESLLRDERIRKDIVPNQRAKKPRELLGLTEAQWHEVRRDHIQLTESLLCKVNLLRRMGLGDMHMEQIMAIRHSGRYSDVTTDLETIAPSWPAARRMGWHQDTIFDMMMDAGTPEKLRRKVARRVLGDLENVRIWRDYFDALKKLDEDLTDPALLLPKSVRSMHDRMYERLRVLREERRRMKEQEEALAMQRQYKRFAERLKKLKQRFSFNACGLVLRPYESAQEVIEEGRALKICIGSYAERYLQGGAIICCLRRAEEPDVPWRAVEFSTLTGKLVQDRGYKNDYASNAADVVSIDEGTRKQLRNFWACFNRAHKSESEKERASA